MAQLPDVYKLVQGLVSYRGRRRAAQRADYKRRRTRHRKSVSCVRKWKRHLRWIMFVDTAAATFSG